MSELKSDDFLLLNREGVDYKITIADLAEYLQVDPVEPEPEELPWVQYLGVKPVYHITNITKATRFQGAEGIWLESGEEFTGSAELPAGLGDYYIMGQAVKFQSGTGEWDFGPDTDTTGLKDCSEMFKTSKNFNGEFGGNWDMSQVTTMESMFEDASSMDRPEIGNWDVHNVTNFFRFLANDRNEYPVFNQSLANWCVPNFTREPKEFWGEKLIGVNRPGWGKCPNGECGTVIPNDFDWKSTVKCHIINVFTNHRDDPGKDTFHWNSADATPFSHFREDGSYCNTGYHFGKNGEEFYCSWDAKDGTPVQLGRHHVLKWDFGPDTDTTGLTNLDYMLAGGKYWMGSFGGNWDTSQVTSMKGTFQETGIDIGNQKYEWPLGNPIEGIDGWDVSKVQNFEECFGGTCHDIEVSNWDTSSANNMNNMFRQENMGWEPTRPGPRESLRGWCVKGVGSQPAGWAWMDEYDAPAWGFCPAEGSHPPALPEKPQEYLGTTQDQPIGNWSTGGLGVLTFKDASGNVFVQSDFSPSDWSGDPARIFNQRGYSDDDQVWHVEVKSATEPPILEWISNSPLIADKISFAYLAVGSEFEVVINGESQGMFDQDRNDVKMMEFAVPDGGFKSLEIKNQQKGKWDNYGTEGYYMSIGNIFIDGHNVQDPRDEGKSNIQFSEDARDAIAALRVHPTFQGGSKVMGEEHKEHRFDIMGADPDNLVVILNHSDSRNSWGNPKKWWFPKD